MKRQLGMAVLVAGVVLIGGDAAGECEQSEFQICGDGIVQCPEECDDGSDNSDLEPDACRAGNCTLPSCGDGVVDTGEECDDGNLNHDMISDACRTSCKLPSCGDGIIDAGEQCDDAGFTGGGGPPPSSSGGSTTGSGPDLCTSDCQLIELVECLTGLQLADEGIAELEVEVEALGALLEDAGNDLDLYHGQAVADAAADIETQADGTATGADDIAADVIGDAAISSARGNLPMALTQASVAVFFLQVAGFAGVDTDDQQAGVSAGFRDRSWRALDDVAAFADPSDPGLDSAEALLSSGDEAAADGNHGSALIRYRLAIAALSGVTFVGSDG